MVAPIELSVVLPCLNEKPSLQQVIGEIKQTCEKQGIRYEIIVADNGSQDGSPREAKRLGARVVTVKNRGYGAAVNGGILAAKGEIVVFADADGSYPFCEIPRLIAPIQNNTADLVVGNRLGPETPATAMPALHRYFGTPGLSFLLRFFHTLDVFDCNGGMRALRRNKYGELRLKRPGMEYASEMLIRAGQCGWRYREIPIGLRPAAQKHVPHLRPWRDGFRHLCTLLAGCFTGINWRKNALLLCIFMLLCGLYGLFLGKDTIWDLLNYHLYNPFAFLNGRFGSDVMPAGIHTFLNPLLDIPLYLGIKYLNNYPKLLMFLWSLPGGFFIFFTYKISQLFFPQAQDKRYIWFVVLLGCSGSMFSSQIGLCTGEIWTASFLAAASYLFFRWLIKNRQNYALAFFAAFITGATTGMKMTAAPFLVAITIVFICNLKGSRHPWKQFAFFAVGGTFGFLLTNGYFMMRLWLLYKNPVFPFFNGLFHSPFFEPENWNDLRFFPKTTLQWIFAPFYWMNQEIRFATEIENMDPRFALGYLGVVGFVLGTLLKKGKIFQRRLIFSLTAMMIITYLLWLNVYSILRYVVILEAFSALLLAWLLRNWLRARWGMMAGVLLLIVCWTGTSAPDWGRKPFDNQPYIYFDPAFPHVKPHALVIFFGVPMSFAAPFFPPGTQFVGGVKFDVEKYPESVRYLAAQRRSLPEGYYHYHFDDQIRQKLQNHRGPVYIMAVPWSMMFHPITIGKYGLKESPEKCQFFNANINKYSRGWALCQVEVIKNAP